MKQKKYFLEIKNKKSQKKFAFYLFMCKILSHFCNFIDLYMSNKQDKIEVEGIIVKTLPGLVFDVQLPEDFWWGIIKGYLSWKMRNNLIKLIEWDTVLVELSPYDLTKGRIIFRQK